MILLVVTRYARVVRVTVRTRRRRFPTVRELPQIRGRGCTARPAAADVMNVRRREYRKIGRKRCWRVSGTEYVKTRPVAYSDLETRRSGPDDRKIAFRICKTIVARRSIKIAFDEKTRINVCFSRETKRV